MEVEIVGHLGGVFLGKAGGTLEASAGLVIHLVGPLVLGHRLVVLAVLFECVRLGDETCCFLGKLDGLVARTGWVLGKYSVPGTLEDARHGQGYHPHDGKPQHRQDDNDALVQPSLLLLSSSSCHDPAFVDTLPAILAVGKQCCFSHLRDLRTHVVAVLFRQSAESNSSMVWLVGRAAITCGRNALANSLAAASASSMSVIGRAGRNSIFA